MTRHKFNRREFAKVSLGVAGGITAAGVTDAGTPESKAVPVGSRETERRDAGTSEEELLLALIRRRYPNPRMHGKVLAGIRRDLKNDLQRSKVLHSFPLKNADEPGFVFAAYRADAIR